MELKITHSIASCLGLAGYPPLVLITGNFLNINATVDNEY